MSRPSFGICSVAEIAVADTHAVVWAGTEQWRKLGPDARRFFERARAGDVAIYFPAVALAEIGMLTHLGRIRLPLPLRTWVAALSTSRMCFVADLTAEVVFRAESFYAIPDPFDRLIAATAAQLECPLITKDSRIRDLAEIEVVW